MASIVEAQYNAALFPRCCTACVRPRPPDGTTGSLVSDAFFAWAVAPFSARIAVVALGSFALSPFSATAFVGFVLFWLFWELSIIVWVWHGTRTCPCEACAPLDYAPGERALIIAASLGAWVFGRFLFGRVVWA